MIKHLFSILFIMLTTTRPSVCHAQNIGNSDYEFAPGDNVIFADDFSGDTAWAFPSKWHFSHCNEYHKPNSNKKEDWTIQADEQAHSLAVFTSFATIEPNITDKYYLHDSFTVDFSFTVRTPMSCAELNFYTYEKQDSCISVRLHILPSGELRIGDFPQTRNIHLASYPAPFDNKVWHHFALAYNKRAIDFYIDKYRVASLPDCGFSPYGVSLGCLQTVKFKNFRITTGKDNNAFAKILTEKKFVTHAINFDVGKSSIKPESTGFINQLAQFLKENPAVKLEIGGHTDSDGDAGANMKLSEERAGEVKKQLVLAGIAGNRLTAKGFGASKPLEPDTTPEGKANNRRVEFIKM